LLIGFVLQHLLDAVGANYTEREKACKPLSAKKLLSLEKLTRMTVSRFNRGMAHTYIHKHR